MGCNPSTNKKRNKTVQKNLDHQFNQEEKEQLSSITSKVNIHTIYSIQKNPIGSGGFGFVKIGTLRTNPNLKVAIKFIEKKRIENKMYMLLREIKILQKLDHPNIVKFYETYEDDKYFYICQEFCEGGELLERITQQGYFKEKQAAFIVQRVASAVNHMHAYKIVHRDLKLENILYLTKDPNSEMKLIDFGLSNKLQGDVLHTQVGTPLYVSPQVLRGTYDEKCDSWSIGVIMYILLSGYPPFYGPNKQKIFEAIEKGKFEFSGKEWSIISQDAKDLISNLLVIDAKKRYSCAQILQHKWFEIQLSQKKKDNQQDLVEAINKVRTFRNPSKFKNEVMNILINQLNETEIRDLNDVFRKIDQDGSGFISITELQEALKQVGLKLEKQEISQIFSQVSDGNHDNQGEKIIKYSDFIKASLNRKVFMKEEKLWHLFKYFDANNLGQITVKDMQEIFKRHGKNYDENEIKNMIQEVDPNKDGKITFDEFKQIMLMDEETLLKNSYSDYSSTKN